MRFSKLFLLLVLLCAITNAGIAGNSDLNITCVAKKAEDGAIQGDKLPGGVSSKTEKWNYTVTLENKSLSAMSGLEVKYVIFYRQEQIASKSSARLQRTTGSSNVKMINPQGKESFATSLVELKKEVLNGSYYFTNGGKTKADDSVAGIWIRVFQNGNLFAEFIKPPSLANKEKFE